MSYVRRSPDSVPVARVDIAVCVTDECGYSPFYNGASLLLQFGDEYGTIAFISVDATQCAVFGDYSCLDILCILLIL